jgi:hypothetical protein
MDMAVRKVRPVNYSPSEKRLLDLIPRDGKRITTEELTKKRYAGESVPFNARMIVLGALTNLIRKVEYNREDFKIVKGIRKGPAPIEVWVEPATRRKSATGGR